MNIQSFKHSPYKDSECASLMKIVTRLISNVFHNLTTVNILISAERAAFIEKTVKIKMNMAFKRLKMTIFIKICLREEDT